MSNANTKKFDTRKLVGLGLLTAIVVVVQFIAAAIKPGPFSITFALMPIVVGAALYGVGAGAWLGFVFGVIVLISGDASTFLAINVPGTIITVLLKGVMAGLAAGLIYILLAKKESMGRITVCISGILLMLLGGFLVYRGIAQNAGKYNPIVFSIRKPNVDPTIDPSEMEKLYKNIPIPPAVIIILGALLLVVGVFLVMYLLIKKPVLGVSPAVFVSAAICPIINTGIFLLGCRVFFFDTIKIWAGGADAITFMIVGLVGLNFILELAINIILVPSIVVIIKYGQKRTSNN